MTSPSLTAAQRTYLTGQLLGRLATVSPDGVVQNNPVAFRLRADDTIDIGGYRMASTKKYRNIAAGSTRVAFVVDDLVSTDPWQARCLEVRGVAAALHDTTPPLPGMTRDVLRITPEWIFAAGIDD
ncbi:MAG: PPOX class F420-dependent oxidoreductase [bacterium]